MSKKLTQEQFIEKAKTIHGDRYLFDRFFYNSNRIAGDLYCRIHGYFPITPTNLYKGQGCPDCGLIKSELSVISRTKTLEQFIMEANLVHNNFYLYHKFIYKNSHTKGIIVCPLHGDFPMTPDNHLHHQGCPSCSSSIGELKIINYLIKNNENYIRQMTCNDCKNLPNYNFLLEYDGALHYKSTEWRGGNNKLLATQRNDAIKTQYCLDNDIPLLRIPYWDEKKIPEILDTAFIIRKRQLYGDWAELV